MWFILALWSVPNEGGFQPERMEDMEIGHEQCEMWPKSSLERLEAVQERRLPDLVVKTAKYSGTQFMNLKALLRLVRKLPQTIKPEEAKMNHCSSGVDAEMSYSDLFSWFEFLDSKAG